MDLGSKLTGQRNARFKELLEPIYPELQRWALYLARNQADAEDVLSQALLLGLEKIHQLKQDGSFKAWMYRIVSTTWHMMLRQRKRPVDSVDPADITSSPHLSQAGIAESSARAAIVRQALEKLSPEQREALVLFEVHGVSTKEIALILGKQESALRVLLHRARARLAGILEQAGLGPEL